MGTWKGRIKVLGIIWVGTGGFKTRWEDREGQEEDRRGEAVAWAIDLPHWGADVSNVCGPGFTDNGMCFVWTAPTDWDAAGNLGEECKGPDGSLWLQVISILLWLVQYRCPAFALVERDKIHTHVCAHMHTQRQMADRQMGVGGEYLMVQLACWHWAGPWWPLWTKPGFCVCGWGGEPIDWRDRVTCKLSKNLETQLLETCFAFYQWHESMYLTYSRNIKI